MTQFNAGERKDIRRREKEAKLADLNRGEVLRNLMSTVPGREWVWNRLASANVFVVSAPIDALQMAFREGERNQGILLLNDVMQWCPDEFILAMREANERRSNDNARSSAGERGSGEDGDWRDQGPADQIDGETGDEAYVHSDLN